MFYISRKQDTVFLSMTNFICCKVARDSMKNHHSIPTPRRVRVTVETAVQVVLWVAHTLTHTHTYTSTLIKPSSTTQVNYENNISIFTSLCLYIPTNTTLTLTTRPNQNEMTSTELSNMISSHKLAIKPTSNHSLCLTKTYHYRHEVLLHSILC